MKNPFKKKKLIYIKPKMVRGNEPVDTIFHLIYERFLEKYNPVVTLPILDDVGWNNYYTNFLTEMGIGYNFNGGFFDEDYKYKVINEDNFALFLLEHGELIEGLHTEEYYSIVKFITLIFTVK